MADKIKAAAVFSAWVFIGWFLYAKVIHAPFLFDDEILIVHNPFVQDLNHGFQSLYNIFHYQQSRFLTNMTVALNFKAGGLDTFGYHLVNLALHILVTAGVWYFTRQLVRLKGVNGGGAIPFWAALIFLVHPLHTESVSYINHRSSILMALFYLWSMVFYLKARIEPRLGQRIMFFIGATISAVLSLASKEAAFSVPFAWLLTDFVVLDKKPSRWVWIILFVCLAILAIVFDFRFKEMLTSGIYSQSHRGDYLTQGTYLLTQLKVSIIFIRLMILPIGLNADYDLPMSHSLLEPQTGAAALMLFLCLVSAWVWRYRNWCWAWCVGAFFVSLLGHFFPARYNVIAEHKLYMTLALIVPAVVIWIFTALGKRAFFILGVVTAIFAVLTVQRNEAWADPVALWSDTRAKSPQKPRPYLNYAASLLAKGRKDEAEAAFKDVVRIAPEYVESYINLAQIATDRGDLNGALAYSDRALRVNPSFDLAYLQNGFLHDRLGHREAAIKSFQCWLKLHPNDRTITQRVMFLENTKKEER